VAELSKAKLERPKRLGELAQRAWGEVLTGTHMWDRQAAEVTQLGSIGREELLDFARQVGRA
jgi:insulysin